MLYNKSILKNFYLNLFISIILILLDKRLKGGN